MVNFEHVKVIRREKDGVYLEFGVEKVELVAGAGGSGSAGIFIPHPRGVREGDRDIDG